MQIREGDWQELGAQDRPSWYLDPIVAEQKKAAHREFLQRGLRWGDSGPVLKTDLFEDAFGSDSVLDESLTQGWIGMDLVSPTVRKAVTRWSRATLRGMAADVRSIPLRTESVGSIVSLSTLDHFPRREDYLQAISELHRVLAPGGQLLLTLDNPHNLLYHPLKALVNWRGPFPLGYTPALETARADCEALGLRVTQEPYWLVHNPRLLSTALFLVLRGALGSYAAWPIRSLLRIFALLPHVLGNTRSACWYGLILEKPKRANC